MADLKTSEYRIQKPSDKILEGLSSVSGAIMPFIRQLVREGVERHNEKNLRVISKRDAAIRAIREATSGDYATISPDSGFYPYYKNIVGGKNYSLKELKDRIDPSFGRTAEFFSLHDGAYGRFLKNGRKISDYDKLSIKKSFDKLKADFEIRNPGKTFMVSARSSGTLIDQNGLPVPGGEDSKDNAFAGMNETILNIASFEELINAIEYCFNQCGNPAVVNYMESKGINPAYARLPLVIQEMVVSESFRDLAGIIFSKSKINPKVGRLEIISGMNEYAVGGQAARFSIDFDRETGEIQDIVRVKQKRALLYNPFRIGNIDTKLDIALPDVMQDRLNKLKNFLDAEDFSPEFYKLVKTLHYIKTPCSEENLIAMARNLVSNESSLMTLARDLDVIEEDEAAQPSEEYINNTIQQVLVQKNKFGYEADMEFVDNAFLQIRSLTGNAVPIEKGPGSELPTIGAGLIASPGVLVGKIMFVDTQEDMDRYLEAAKNESIIPVFPIADTLYTPVETDENCNGAIALEGTPNGHAGIIAAEISITKPETGFPYLVGVTGADGELIKDFSDFARQAGLQDGDYITLDCWSPNVGDGVIYKGADVDLMDKWRDWWKNNQYEIKEEIRRPDGEKVSMGAIISIPEAVEAAYKANFDYISLFRMEVIYREGIDDQRLPEEMRNIPCHPDEYFARGLGEVFEDHLFDRLKLVVDSFPNKPITIRAMDFQGPDMKSLKFYEKYTAKESEAEALIGMRGAALFLKNQNLFDCEAKVIKRLLDHIKTSGKTNTIKYMYPFFRAPSDAELFVKLKKEHGLEDGKDGLKLGIMLEVAGNAFSAQLFKRILEKPVIRAMFNGKLPFSFGSIGMNDLIQFILGRGRNSSALTASYKDSEGLAYSTAVESIFEGCEEYGIECSTCGDAPGKNPEVAKFLYELGIKFIGVSQAFLGLTHQGLLKNSAKQKKSRKFVMPFFSKLEA